MTCPADYYGILGCGNVTNGPGNEGRIGLDCPEPRGCEAGAPSAYRTRRRIHVIQNVWNLEVNRGHWNKLPEVRRTTQKATPTFVETADGIHRDVATISCHHQKLLIKKRET